MFLNECPEEHKVYLPQGTLRDVCSVIFLGSPRNIRAYVTWCHMAKEHNFFGSDVYVNLRSSRYVP
jgi:hypothetical protein